MKKMVNLEQVRARNAMKLKTASGENDGEVIKKIPPLIMNHGLLATMAFAFDDKKTGFKKVFDAIAKHLSDPEIAILSDVRDCESLMRSLTENADSETLKQATLETMAWLSFARRFVKKN